MDPRHEWADAAGSDDQIVEGGEGGHRVVPRTRSVGLDDGGNQLFAALDGVVDCAAD